METYTREKHGEYLKKAIDEFMNKGGNPFELSAVSCKKMLYKIGVELPSFKARQMEFDCLWFEICHNRELMTFEEVMAVC